MSICGMRPGLESGVWAAVLRFRRKRLVLAGVCVEARELEARKNDECKGVSYYSLGTPTLVEERVKRSIEGSTIILFTFNSFRALAFEPHFHNQTQTSPTLASVVTSASHTILMRMCAVIHN